MNLKLFLKKNKSDIIWFISLAITMVVLRIFILSPVTVSGESMMPTLVDKEKIIASKVSKIKRFDIVPLKAPDKEDTLYIKRIIGLPGEHIEYKNDILYINGEQYDEPYLDEYKDITTGNLTEDFTLDSLLNSNEVPKDSYFVLGDNRQNSKDSRMIGFIKKEDIIGSSKISLWPINKIGFF